MFATDASPPFLNIIYVSHKINLIVPPCQVETNLYGASPQFIVPPRNSCFGEVGYLEWDVSVGVFQLYLNATRRKLRWQAVWERNFIDILQFKNIELNFIGNIFQYNCLSYLLQRGLSYSCGDFILLALDLNFYFVSPWKAGMFVLRLQTRLSI